MSLPRPLDPVRSIKLKLGLLVMGATGAALVFFRYQIGWLPPRTALAALVIALVTTQVLAHGMTKPLRQMTAAARAMAGGDYSRRVRATSRDEVGELALAFNRMAADLGAADQQRREMIANVSHELRTPITALRAVLENAVDGVTGEDALKTALGQTERLGRLVTELLDLSRIDAGVQPLHRESFEIEPLLREAVAETRADVRFTVEVSPPGARAFADRERLHQVVANLLDNAVRHGPADGEVRVRATAVGSGLAIEVADDGPGIAPADRERVFERFTRGERAGDGGTGLGLAIARWVAELHGGRIAVVGESGCRIRLDLPGS
ncbi:sensor histidine kinase [Amycolatopsis magusensis]|uniref:Signal transduction histidine-protein kinase/phosphatase MprB n=1 Tax=Amycolatopsis magusensis TaxID=882444 RepID=A0ABS4PHU2_9PSEU|nr:HAMP domain-containing sensor histidine kinase [Amycolatopsis magusensis]MBP2178945.1 signal transduction histidine kinase [Amycolatopsis magusensis]MDI5975232.1 HAMP domain-containing sensor histidine kinase [Amycolatopsis magusensis]